MLALRMLKEMLLVLICMNQTHAPTGEEKRIRRAKLAAKFPNRENQARQVRRNAPRGYMHGDRAFDTMNQVNTCKLSGKLLASEFHNRFA